MTDDDLHDLMHIATRDIRASDSLKGRLSARQLVRTGARRWWVAGVAAAAAVATLVAVPLLRPSTTSPPPATPPAVSTGAVTATSDVVSSTGTSDTVSGLGEDAPTPADVTACRTDAPSSTPRTHRYLLCFFAPIAASTSAGALVIGVVDPAAVDDVRAGFSAHSSMLCLTFYSLWVVTGDLPRQRLTGCEDGATWQKAIDDQAGHIHWTVVDAAELCGASGHSGNPIGQAPVRMALVCTPGAPASVLTGAAATALATAMQQLGAGAPCTLSGYSVTAVVQLGFYRLTLPTVKTASGCQLAPQVRALLNGER